MPSNGGLIMKNLSRVLSSCFVFGLPLPPFAHQGSEHYGPHMMWQGYGMMMGPFMMILFIAVITGVSVLIYKGLTGHSLWFGVKLRRRPN